MAGKPSFNLARALELLPGEMETASVPGLVLAAVEGADVSIRPFGLKNNDTGESVTDETLFPGASLTKPVFTYGVLGLVRDGLLELDRALGDYLSLPEAQELPELNAITARQVLSHSSGLQNWRFSLEDSFSFAFPPGSGYQYSGEGYFYLQRVVEEITGQGIEAFMQSQVLQPLGMANSSLIWKPEYEQTMAAGHQRAHHGQIAAVPSWNARFGKKLWEIAVEDGKPVQDWRFADVVDILPRLHPKLKPLGNDMLPNVAASLVTTAGDYARFLARILADPPPGMLSPQIHVNPAISWGLGWGLAHFPHGQSFWHWGDNGPFKAFVDADFAAGRALVIFTNGERGLRLCEKILRRATGTEHPAFLWL